MLTELEGDVLGFIWKLGPVTTYRVRKIFAESPSSHWRASAGSIYPVVERLAERGFVQSQERRRGSRRSALLTISAQGRRALGAWIAPDELSEIVEHVHDPIRTRIHFLGLLPVRQRRGLLRRILSKLESQIMEYEQLVATESDEWDRVVLDGAMELQRARLRWLRNLEIGATPALRSRSRRD